MRLYLVRHAIAEDSDPESWPDDSKRPLTGRGVRRFRRAARGLGRIVPSVDAVLSSPYVRAWETALILEDKAGWPEPVECPELTVDDPPRVLDALKPFGDADSVALVGHEPYLSRLAAALLSPGAWGPWLQFGKGGVALLEAVDADPPRYELIWHLPPKLLRALARS
jgi:phosphohistidine phosphatase